MALIRDFRPESLTTPAFIFDRETPKDSKVTKHLTSIDEIEASTGLGFFSDFSDDLGNGIDEKSSEEGRSITSDDLRSVLSPKDLS